MPLNEKLVQLTCDGNQEAIKIVTELLGMIKVSQLTDEQAKKLAELKSK